MPKFDSAIRLLGVIMVETLAILRASLGRILQPEDFSKRTGNGCTLEPDLAVIHAIDIPDQHIHPRVVAAIRHGQHVVKGAGSGQQRHQSPEGSTPQMCSPDTLELPWSGDLDHRHTRPYVDQQVRVHVWPGLGKMHWFGIGITVREDLVGDLCDKEVQAYCARSQSASIWASGRPKLTNDETLHLLLPQDVDVQRLLQLVVEFERSSTSSHDTQLIARFAIALLVFLLELPNKVDADVDPMGFEVEEVQSASIVFGADLPGEIDELRQ